MKIPTARIDEERGTADVADSGVYWRAGVHLDITVDNSRISAIAFVDFIWYIVP